VPRCSSDINDTFNTFRGQEEPELTLTRRASRPDLLTGLRARQGRRPRGRRGL